MLLEITMKNYGPYILIGLICLICLAFWPWVILLIDGAIWMTSLEPRTLIKWTDLRILVAMFWPVPVIVLIAVVGFFLEEVRWHTR